VVGRIVGGIAVGFLLAVAAGWLFGDGWDYWNADERRSQRQNEEIAKQSEANLEKLAESWFVDDAEYERIQQGMTLEEATALLGEGTRVPDGDGDSATVTYRWGSPQIGGTVEVTFVDGAVVSKQRTASPRALGR